MQPELPARNEFNGVANLDEKGLAAFRTNMQSLHMHYDEVYGPKAELNVGNFFDSVFRLDDGKIVRFFSIQWLYLVREDDGSSMFIPWFTRELPLDDYLSQISTLPQAQQFVIYL